MKEVQIISLTQPKTSFSWFKYTLVFVLARFWKKFFGKSKWFLCEIKETFDTLNNCTIFCLIYLITFASILVSLLFASSFTFNIFLRTRVCFAKKKIISKRDMHVLLSICTVFLYLKERKGITAMYKYEAAA